MLLQQIVYFQFDLVRILGSAMHCFKALHCQNAIAVSSMKRLKGLKSNPPE
jgi:hypothetical protein